MESRLYEASLNGDVEALNTLIQEDPLILDRLTVGCFNENPLHIAALRGHFDFTKAVMGLNPNLVTEVDSNRRSPLHLACDKGHVDIVRELLHSRSTSEVCLCSDKDGLIPLHLAVMKGCVEVIQELIQARLDSIMVRLKWGQTVLHLCVKYNALETLKWFLESRHADELVNSKDDDGNTTLHVAVALKNLEIVKYLLSRSGVEANKNAMNKNGLTALDVLEHCPKDVKGMEILYFLREAGVRRGANEIITITTTTTIPPPPPPQEEEVANHQHNEIAGPKKMSKIGKWMKYLRTSHGEKWYEETQQTLMLVATVLASMSFQAAMNPPGGVWQADTVKSEISKSDTCTASDPCYAGTSVLAYAYPYWYREFLIFNTSSLIASLSIILFIISGFPLKNKFCMWLLILTMCIAVVFMTLAYLVGMTMVADAQWDANAHNTYDIAVYIWLGIIGTVGLIFLARFLYWLVRKLREFMLKMRSGMRKLHEFTLKMRSGMKNESRTLGA